MRLSYEPVMRLNDKTCLLNLGMFGPQLSFGWVGCEEAVQGQGTEVVRRSSFFWQTLKTDLNAKKEKTSLKSLKAV